MRAALATVLLASLAAVAGAQLPALGPTASLAVEAPEGAAGAPGVAVAVPVTVVYDVGGPLCDASGTPPQGSATVNLTVTTPPGVVAEPASLAWDVAALSCEPFRGEGTVFLTSDAAGLREILLTGVARATCAAACPPEATAEARLVLDVAAPAPPPQQPPRVDANVTPNGAHVAQDPATRAQDEAGLPPGPLLGAALGAVALVAAIVVLERRK